MSDPIARPFVKGEKLRINVLGGFCSWRLGTVDRSGTSATARLAMAWMVGVVVCLVVERVPPFRSRNDCQVSDHLIDLCLDRPRNEARRGG